MTIPQAIRLPHFFIVEGAFSLGADLQLALEHLLSIDPHGSAPSHEKGVLKTTQGKRNWEKENVFDC